MISFRWLRQPYLLIVVNGFIKTRGHAKRGVHGCFIVSMPLWGPGCSYKMFSYVLHVLRGSVKVHMAILHLMFLVLGLYANF